MNVALELPKGPPPAPMGARGEYPVYFSTAGVAENWLRGVLEIPCVVRVPGGVRCTWDIAWAVARLLKVPEPDVPSWEGPLPGLARYRSLGLHEKTWPKQKEDILFLARRAWAVLAEPMRAGKCLMSLGAATVIDSRKTLIVCPKYARLGWADEVKLWMQEPAVLLCGRGGRELRARCLHCVMGELADGTACPHCRARNGQSNGYKVFEVPAITAQDARVSKTDDGRRYCALPPMFWCRKHPEVQTQERYAYCGRCQAEMQAELDRARFVVVNYELLVQQHIDIGGGKIGKRDDLAGWVGLLKNYQFDVLIADEAQMLRGWTTSTKRQGEARNERTLELVGDLATAIRIPRVWMVTGTPFYGFTRDIFWLLDIASGGLWGGDTRMRGKKFMVRYCAGKKTSCGFQAKGRTVFAETELMRRLHGTGKFDGVMLQRTREEMFADTPPVPRKVERLEIEGVRPYGRMKRGGAGIAKLIVANTALKLEAMLDRFMDALSEGLKIIVFTFHVPSAKRTFLAIEKAMQSQTYRTRMKQVRARAWLSTGPQKKKKKDSPIASFDSVSDGGDELVLTDEQKKNWASEADARYHLAAAYRAHDGAGVCVATIDSMPGALSMKGASIVWFLDLHWSPGAMAQAEMRPWYPGVRDLTIIYCLATGSVDDHVEAEVLPKVENLVRLAKDKGSEAMLNAFNAEDENRTADAIFDRLTKHLRLDVSEDLDGELLLEG